jgi:hypothetical protein
MEQHLSAHEIGKEFSDVLRQTKAFVAGSFIVGAILGAEFKSNEFKSNDIDIWLPHSQDSGVALGKLVCFFLHHAYQLPIPSIRESKRTLPATYKRLQTAVQRVYSMHAKNKIKIQIILLRQPLSPKAVVSDFDLTMLKAWYDGDTVHFYEESEQHLKNRTMAINFNSKEVTEQNAPEWLRTLKRIGKYKERGFTLQKNDKTYECFLSSLCKYDILSINKFVSKWNQTIEDTRITTLPYVFVTRDETNIHLGVTSTLQYTNVEWKSIPAKELNSMIKHPKIITNTNTNYRVFKWITPLPVEYVQNQPRDCFDFILAETVGTDAYIADNTDNIVLVTEVNDILKATCYTKELLRQALVFYKCNSDTLENVDVHKSIAQITLAEFTVYISTRARKKVLRSNHRYFTLRKKSTWTNTVSVRTYYGHAGFVSADHCQNGTGKDIYTIKARSLNDIK